MQTVCEWYQQASKLMSQHDAITICVDEMTGIQALERMAPKKCDPARENASNLNTSATAA